MRKKRYGAKESVENPLKRRCPLSDETKIYLHENGGKDGVKFDDTRVFFFLKKGEMAQEARGEDLFHIFILVKEPFVIV